MSDIIDLNDEQEVPLYKKALCGDHFFGNIFYPIWGSTDCLCCSFFRGVVTGIFIANVLFAVGYVVGNML